MALLLVKVPEEGTLLLNEFFDYDGCCYACAAGRSAGCAAGMELEDFYEATIRTDHLENIPVAFVLEQGDGFVLAGWYDKAKIFRKSSALSLFMEGNICADLKDSHLLSVNMRTEQVSCTFGDKLYEVVETDDDRYTQLMAAMDRLGGKNALIRYDDVDISIPAGDKQNKEKIRETCMALAADLMSDSCVDLRDIKRLEIYARRLTLLDGRSADGYYYEAMAAHQLGHTRQGIKAIERALRLEGEAGDLLAMKANLLVSMKKTKEAAALFHEAWLQDADEIYLIQEGRCLMLEGKMDQAYDVLRQVKDKQALDEAGINLKDMERRWPFINVRGLNFKHIFGLK